MRRSARAFELADRDHWCRTATTPTELREIILDAFDMSLGTGLGRLKGKIFRIGHLGWFNDLMLCGTLSGVEMGLHRAGIPHRAGGVNAALDFLGSA